MQINPEWWTLELPFYDTGNEQLNIHTAKIKGSDYSRFDDALLNSALIRGEDIDISIAYAQVDGRCPWTNYTVLNKADGDSQTVFTNDGVPLINYIIRGENMYVGGADQGQNFPLGTGSGYKVTLPNYQCASWYNSEAEGLLPTFSYDDGRTYAQIAPNTGGFIPVGKFGGKAYLLEINVYASQTVSGNVTSFTLDNYCNTQYANYPYIRSVAVVPWSYDANGRKQLPSGGNYDYQGINPGASFLPLTEDITITRQGGNEITLSTWDVFSSTAHRRYQNIFGFAGGDSQNYSKMQTANIAYMVIDEKAQIVDAGNGVYVSSTKWDEIAPTIAEVREYFRKSVAYLGLFFTDGAAPTNRPTFTEDYIMLGLMDGDGITHGEYSKGTANSEQVQFNSENMQVDSNVDPTSPPDPSPIPESNPSSVLSAGKRTLGTPGANIYISTLNQFTQIKVATETKYAGIIAAAESGDFDTATSLASEFGHTQNPNGCFYTVLVYPFDITKYLNNLGSTDTARIGKSDYKALTNFNHVSGTTVYGTIDCGQIFFPYDQTHGGKNNPNAFTNYAPYTSASLTLPFCGTIKIDPTVYSNCYIGVKYLVDWRTGVCQALIHRSTKKGNYGVVMETVNGQMAYRINLSADNASNYANDLLRASSEADNAQRAKWTTAISYGATAVAAAKNMAGGNVAEGAIAIANAANKIVSAKNTADIASYSLETKEIPLQQISSANPAINTLGEMKIRLNIFKSPIEPGPGFNAVYGHTIGFATLEFGKPTNRKGYTVMDSIDTDNISVATEQEKAQIKQLVKSGVYFGEPTQT